MTSGVMQEIRERLSGGQSSGEVIAQGYAPPTVYKVQKRLRQETSTPTGTPPAVVTPPSAAATARVQELETEVVELEGLVESLEDQASELRDADTRLAEARSKMAELETASAEAAQRADALESQLREANIRVRDLEARASEAGKLRHAVAESQARLHRTVSVEAKLRQDVIGWQQQYETEHEARAKAEQQWAAWEGVAGRFERQNEELKQRVAELAPLSVWIGHPCKVCQKPMKGAVTRDAAGKLLGEFGHSACVKQDAAPGKALLAGAAGLFVLSKMH